MRSRGLGFPPVCALDSLEQGGVGGRGLGCSSRGVYAARKLCGFLDAVNTNPLALSFTACISGKEQTRGFSCHRHSWVDCLVSRRRNRPPLLPSACLIIGNLVPTGCASQLPSNPHEGVEYTGSHQRTPGWSQRATRPPRSPNPRRRTGDKPRRRVSRFRMASGRGSCPPAIMGRHSSWRTRFRR